MHWGTNAAPEPAVPLGRKWGRADSALGEKATRQVMDLWVTPEVRRRQELGELPRPLDLRAAQVVFRQDGSPPLVRVNHEVRAIAQMRIAEGVSKEKGDLVYDRDVIGLGDMRLLDDEEPVCGHFTLIRIGESWVGAFDARHNKGLAREHLDVAEQFLHSARLSLDRGHWGPLIDELFSAAELAAKAFLLLMPGQVSEGHKRLHRRIGRLYNRHRELGNVPPDHANALNRLTGLRGPARYLDRPYTLERAEAEQLFSHVSEMVATGRAWASKHVDDTGNTG